MQKHTRDWLRPIDLWRFGTYWTNVNVLRVGGLWSFGIGVRGHYWHSRSLPLP